MGSELRSAFWSDQQVEPRRGPVLKPWNGAASYCKLGLACRRSGREAEAIRRLNGAVDAWPESIYGRAATKELNRGTIKSDAERR